MKALSLRSPAKLNLYLRVVNKRPDGYHNIVTLFERINLFDDLHFALLPKSRIQIRCDHPHVPLGPKNLIFRVARLLQSDFKITDGVKIDIEKRIPVAAGLAGGSGNAATALLALNRLWGLNLKRDQLISYGRRIGSDVAFFLNDCSWALGTERGDAIKRLNLNTKLWHVVVVPRLKMYSWKVYGALKLKLTKRSGDVNILIHYLKKKDIFALNRFLYNDLEAVITRFSPSLLSLKQRLNTMETQGVMISGSGPAVFAITQTEQEAQKIKDVLSKRFQQTYVVHTY